MPQHYSLTLREQHRPNKHSDFERKYCLHCFGANKSSPRPETPWEIYETASANPYAIQVLTDKCAKTRRDILSSLNTKKVPSTNPKMTREKQTKAIVGRKNRSRNLKGTRVPFDDEMDIHQARLLNIDREYNDEEDLIYYDHEIFEPSKIEKIEYLRAIFPDLRDIAEDMALGDAASDEDLKAMGLLYDSEDEHEHFMETPNQAVPVSCTPLFSPMTPTYESDLDELWEIIQGRLLPVEERGEWDIVSEF
ncbi:hypothetical protein H072_4871 [Dactylellina haptotyla CBS 200.50]|uniref:Uncharacterized protein n=1 Tax=Dactylellina haptotyla (strain CBS 200.50) TaxID=1284197 RepID=S8BP11_DACHA|nr:hypothetical protein H072_4871 [Dactylellina haptotyla CBS 200.50]